MNEEFTDEEVAMIINTIRELSDQLGWTMRAVAMDDDEGGIGGIIMGTDEFISELDLDVSNDETLH